MCMRTQVLQRPRQRKSTCSCRLRCNALASSCRRILPAQMLHQRQSTRRRCSLLLLCHCSALDRRARTRMSLHRNSRRCSLVYTAAARALWQYLEKVLPLLALCRCTCTLLRVCVCVFIYVYVYVCMYVCISPSFHPSIHSSIHPSIHAHTHTHSLSLSHTRHIGYTPS